jgi:hypothetical protein
MGMGQRYETQAGVHVQTFADNRSGLAHQDKSRRPETVLFHKMQLHPFFHLLCCAAQAGASSMTLLLQPKQRRGMLAWAKC